MNIYTLIADILVILHFIFILFTIFGGFLVFKWKKISYIHITAVIWAVLIEIKGWICPLTPLEQKFRDLSGYGGYKESFIEHYIEPLIYPQGLTKDISYILAILLIAINIAIYLALIYRKRRI